MTQYLKGKQAVQRNQLASMHESTVCNFWITYINAYSTMNTMDKSNDFLGFSLNCLLISFMVFLMFV